MMESIVKADRSYLSPPRYLHGSHVTIGSAPLLRTVSRPEIGGMAVKSEKDSTMLGCSPTRVATAATSSVAARPPGVPTPKRRQESSESSMDVVSTTHGDSVEQATRPDEANNTLHSNAVNRHAGKERIYHLCR